VRCRSRPEGLDIPNCDMFAQDVVLYVYVSHSGSQDCDVTPRILEVKSRRFVLPPYVGREDGLVWLRVK